MILIIYRATATLSSALEESMPNTTASQVRERDEPVLLLKHRLHSQILRVSQRLDTLLNFLQTYGEGPNSYTEEILRVAEGELASIQADLERLEEDVTEYLSSLEDEQRANN